MIEELRDASGHLLAIALPEWDPVTEQYMRRVRVSCSLVPAAIALSAMPDMDAACSLGMHGNAWRDASSAPESPDPDHSALLWFMHQVKRSWIL